MNILLVSEFAYPIIGGTERHVFGLAKYLKKKNEVPVILTPNWDNFPSFEVIDGIKFYRFNPIFFRIGFFRMFYYFFYILFVSFKEKIGVIHSFYTLSALSSASFAGLFLRKKTILTLFEPEPIEHYSNTRVGFLFTKIVFKNAFKVTCLNWQLAKIVREKFELGNVVTIPNWISDFFIEESKKCVGSKKKQPKRILFVGRLCEQKGCFVLIRSLPKILEKFDAELFFVGPQYEQKQAKSLVESLGLKEKVFFMGLVSDKELANEYCSSDVLVYPSLYKGGFGFTVIEAMAFSKPVVVSDDLGIPEAAGNAGLVCKRNDAFDLAEKIVLLFSDEKLYKNLSKNAFERSEEFLEEKIIELYLSIYLE